jgi:hypothetical protein
MVIPHLLIPFWLLAQFSTAMVIPPLLIPFSPLAQFSTAMVIQRLSLLLGSTETDIVGDDRVGASAGDFDSVGDRNFELFGVSVGERAPGVFASKHGLR